MIVFGIRFVIIIQMVILLEGSSIDSKKYPYTHTWDFLVRKHYLRYQQQIDAFTYQLQRIQRSYLVQSFSYPKFYHNELLALNLLRRKQQIGEIQQTEVNIYKNIDPTISQHLNITFQGRALIPIWGTLIGGAVFAYSSYFNFSIPTRFVMTALPILTDFVRIARDPRNDQKCLEFLDWLIGYRKAKCLNEKWKPHFSSEEVKYLLMTDKKDPWRWQFSESRKPVDPFSFTVIVSDEFEEYEMI